MELILFIYLKTKRMKKELEKCTAVHRPHH